MRRAAAAHAAHAAAVIARLALDGDVALAFVEDVEVVALWREKARGEQESGAFEVAVVEWACCWWQWQPGT